MIFISLLEYPKLFVVGYSIYAAFVRVVTCLEEDNMTALIPLQAGFEYKVVVFSLRAVTTSR